MIFNSRKSSVAPEDIVKGGSLCMSDAEAPVRCNAESLPQSQERDDTESESCMGSREDGYSDTDYDVVGERVLANGDMFVGSLQGNVPEGSGKYLWSDGCMYEGEWSNGKKSGTGKISWPSGATYEGDFMTGYIHGTGTFTGVNNSTYKGSWSMNEKTGFGTKSYANGDVYEGSWNQGLPDGNGKYLWKNGNEYNGEWKSGFMCGKGVLSWACGDKYEGDWLDGLEHGHGVYTWADGSVYIGTWSRGLKDGKGTFIPSVRNTSQRSISNIDELDGSDCEDLAGEVVDDTVIPPRRTISEGVLSSLDESDGSSDEGLDSPGPQSSWASDSERLVERNYSISSTDKRTCSESSTCSDGLSIISTEGYSEANFSEQAPRPSAVVEREYVQGVLINELVKGTPMLYRSKQLKRWYRNQSKQPIRPGETIFKGHQSYELMINLQLGIRYTVGKITPEPQRELYPADFGPRARIWMNFPREGSQLTPPHQSVDFKWKDYCPMVFRHLRELFKIDTADYMLSICGDNGLRELSSPGKSGSVFYLSHDDRYMIKTMRKSEVKALLAMLPNYYEHVQKYENTLVAKFFGLHRIKPAGGQKVRFIVMGNMFRTELQIHRRFDLKGSSQGRSADKQNMNEHTTLKDLDLDFVFRLEPSWRKVLLRQIECDCKFLESEGIMDYSLLLGLHFRAPLLPTEGETMDSKGLFLVAHEPQTDPVSAGAHVRGSPLKADTAGSEEIDLLLPGTARLRIQLGVNMPARADRFDHFGNGQSPQELSGESYDVVLYFGIIDILQVYDMGKKLEHAYKSLQFDASSISAVDPCSYSKRFQDFLHQIFPES